MHVGGPDHNQHLTAFVMAHFALFNSAFAHTHLL